MLSNNSAEIQKLSNDVQQLQSVVSKLVLKEEVPNVLYTKDFASAIKRSVATVRQRVSQKDPLYTPRSYDVAGRPVWIPEDVKKFCNI